MGKLRPTSSIAKLAVPSWDVEPTSPSPATATTNPPPPDSLATNPPQTDSASSDSHEKTSAASPKSTITSPSFTSHVEPERSAPPLHHLDEIESVQAEVFPPLPPVVAATVPGNQIVPYVPLESSSNKQESGRNGHGFGLGTAATGPYGLPEGHANSHGAAVGPEAMFPPQKAGHHLPLQFANNESVPAHDNKSEAAGVAGSVAGTGPTGLQPGGPPVILIPFVGNPWRSGLFDCCQHPTNGSLFQRFDEQIKLRKIYYKVKRNILPLSSTSQEA